CPTIALGPSFIGNPGIPQSTRSSGMPGVSDQEVAMSDETPHRKILLAHANSWHDAALAVAEADSELVYAEAVERHTQSKRAVGDIGAFYSWRPMQRALREIGLWPAGRADLTTVSTWDEKAFHDVLR